MMTPTHRATRSLARSLSAGCAGGALLGVLWVALAGGGLGCPPVFANPHPELRDFLPSGHYVLHVDGKVVPKAKIYHSEKAAAYLISAETFDVGVLVMPRTGCVEAVESDQMVEREDGGIDLQLEATPCGLGKFRLVGTDVVFRVKELPARLKPKPPLLGTHWSSKLVEHAPEYGRAAEKYRPDQEKVKALVDVGKKARVQIFFGTWCSFCNRFLPNTLKVEEELKKAGAEVTFEFHGLPPPPAAWSTKEALQMRVRRLPTGLVFVDGKMIGRLEGNEWIRPEASLTRVIR